MALTERLALLIDADAKGAVRELDRVGKAADRSIGGAESRIDKMGRTFTSTGLAMVGTAAILGAGLWKAAGAASDLNETVSQSEQIFGNAAGIVGDFAENATAIGMSERAAREAANTFGLFFTNAGKSGDEAAVMSEELTKLAADAASFKNTTPEEAVEAFGAALRGESEPIRRYGVMLDDATLKQRAMDMGLRDTTTGTLPPAIRMQAAYAEIIAQTSTIQGDFERTSDGAANQQRIMRAEMEDAAASIGEGFLPVMNSVLGVAGDVASKFGNLNDSTGGLLGTLGGFGVVGLGVSGAMLTIVGKAIEMRDTFGMVMNKAKGMKGSLGNLVPALGGIGAAAVGVFAVTEGIRALSGAINDGRFGGVADDMGALQHSLQEMGEGELAGIVAQDIEGLAGAINTLAAHEDIPGGASIEGFIRDNLDGVDEASEQITALDDALAELIRNDPAAGKQAFDTLSASLADAGVESENVIGQLNGTRQALRDTGQAAGLVAAVNRTLADSQTDATTATEEQSTETEDLGEAYNDARDELEKLIDQVDEYFGRFDTAADLASEFYAAQDAITESIKETGWALDDTGAAFDLRTEAGREQREAMLEAKEAAIDLGQAVLNEGGSAEQATAATLGHVDALRQQMIEAGLTEDQVNALLWQMGLTPAQVTTTFDAVGVDEARKDVEAYTQAIRDAVTAATVTAAQTVVGRFAGSLFGGERAAGGPVGAGKMYEVNEQGPELLSVGGRDFLMMGSQGGNVTPNHQLGGGGVVVHQTNHYSGVPIEAQMAQADRMMRRQLTTLSGG